MGSAGLQMGLLKKGSSRESVFARNGTEFRNDTR